MKVSIVISLMLAALQVSAQWNFNSDKLSHEGKSIISRIENDNIVPSDTMGFGYLPKDYPLTLLREKLTIDELFELTSHSNPIVRCYGFKALTQRDEKVAFRVITNHLQDTIVVSTHQGCFPLKMFVGDYFIDVFRGNEAISHDSLHLSMLDSLLLFTPNKLVERNGAIIRAGKHRKYYDRIKNFVVNDKLDMAVVALAKFRRSEDVDIIMQPKVTGDHNQLGITLFAISQFPHPKFLPFLEGHLQQIMTESPSAESSLAYQAISNYNSKEASALLARAFQITNKELRLKHLERLSRVLKINPSPIYKDLREKISAELKN